ncbi:MAG TPA: 50S ribosomal protein L22 [Candidatus Saccharimonadales bacterium]|nr:50S ribosomal protein L22 [Candidatus Saccharimonadales bacterium]
MAEMIKVQATAKGVRQSPRKIGLVSALVRGRTVADALTILGHTPKRAASPVAKVIASAKANAISKGLAEKSLRIDQLQVTSGPRLKRYMPAAQGRALPFMKRSSHILVVLGGEMKPKKVAAKAETKKEAK